MLALDNTLRHIDTSESDVLDLFQSSPLPVNLAGSWPEPRSAYICAVKKKNKVQVYVALAGEHGRNFVYTRSDSYDSEKTYQDSLEGALAFARSMGFAPERVNLDYSPAMRAVVVRNYKIFNFSGNAKKITASGPSLAHQKVSPEESAAAITAPIASVASVAAAGAAAAVAGTAAAALSHAVSKSAAGPGKGNEKGGNTKEAITDLIVKFGNEMSALRAKRDELAAKVQELSAAHLGVTAELKVARTENGKLVAERDKLAKLPSEMAALQKKLAALSREHDEAVRKAEELDAEHAALLERTCRVEEELALAQKEAAGAREVAASAEGNAAGATENLAKAIEEAAKAKEEAAKAKEEAAKAKDEVAKAKAEAAKTIDETAVAKEETIKAQEAAAGALEDAAAARQELTKIQEEAARSKKEAAKLLKERDLAAKRAEELVQGSREVKGLEAKAASACAQRDAAVSRAEKLEQQVQAQNAELDATRSELAVLVAACENLLGLATGRASQVVALHPKEEEADLEAEVQFETEVEADAPEEAAAEVAASEEIEEAEIQAESVEEPAAEIDIEFDDETEVEAEAEAEARAEAEAQPEAKSQPEVQLEAEMELDLDVQTETVLLVSAHDDAGMGGFSALGAIAPLADFADMSAQPAEADFPALPFAGFGPANDFFGDFSVDGDPTMFLLKKDLTSIDYSSPEDVVQLHKSFNIANVAPDGVTQERCEGYICCVRRQGQVEVYAAICGKETGKIGVYVPEAQGSDDEGVAAAVAGAVTFHQQVGLMVERVDLPSAQRTGVLANCPVLRQVS